MGENAELKAALAKLGFKQEELAGQMNTALQQLTGRTGNFSDRTVRNLLNGSTSRPVGKTRIALESVFGRPIAELGFRPPSSEALREDSVLRRRFVTATTSIVAASAIPATSSASPKRIGTQDVERLQERFAEIIASDHRHGGQRDIEVKAAAMSGEALDLQESGSASQRVRSHLYGTAAAFRSSAMWAAIDGRRYDAAIAHMQAAQHLAEMSGDSAIKFRIWSHAGTMYRHMGRHVDAAAANQVARNLDLTRRDPMFASLGLARQGAIHGAAGDKNATRRAFHDAQVAMDRADPLAYRPVWMNAFFDQAELHSLALSAYLALGDHARAEYHAHQCLASLRPHMARSKAISTTRLARAQLEQGDLEPAVVTAMSVSRDAAMQHPRVAGMLHVFGKRLQTLAPASTEATTWTQYALDTRKAGL
ncbi:XRE family transcriptional regulator [Streptomyces sp. NPDC056883]|uniref:XRE family transcriptional regulator n=1 Tax=Streptomyces sp. NPDC056883 TaxID=3345959 RepID=UPI0036B35BD0